MIIYFFCSEDSLSGPNFLALVPFDALKRTLVVKLRYDDRSITDVQLDELTKRGQQVYFPPSEQETMVGVYDEESDRSYTRFDDSAVDMEVLSYAVIKAIIPYVEKLFAEQTYRLN